MIRAQFQAVAVLLSAFLTYPLLSPAQSALQLPGCEAAPDLGRTMDEKLDWNLLERMKFSERMTYERRVLEDLMVRYPHEFEPFRRYGDLLHQYAPEEYPAIRSRWIEQAKAHPDDPFALFIGGKALEGKDTPEAIRVLEAARKKAPNFPLPALYLAGIYFDEKWGDATKAKENLEAFFAECPASTDGYAQWQLNKDQPLQPKVAAALRARLATETDPKRLKAYTVLWGLEFRTRPANEHDSLRAQVAEDLKRLETLNPQGDADWQSTLISGYRQSGASKQAITAREDRLIHDFPHSSQAWNILNDRWDRGHPEPPDQSDAKSWARYRQDYREALKGWIRDYPDVSYLQRNAWFSAIWEEDEVSEKDGVSALDSFLQATRDFDAPRGYDTSFAYRSAAQFLIQHRWQPARALNLAELAKAVVEENRAAEADDDNLGEQGAKDRQEWHIREDQGLDGLILRAALQAGQPAPGLKLAASLEAPLPEAKKLQSGYWLNRARLEVLRNHKQDALTYYQMALAVRAEAPKPQRGTLRDDLTDEARALWKEEGGTEAAWAVWSKPAGGAEQGAEGRWEKPTRQIPDFELTDLSGKTWRLKELGGKTLLINLWATWCGPCRGELPRLEKFYEKVKERSDIQVLTFDLDEELGMVAPFVKEKGFTFPVLPAYSTVVSLLDGFAIPQIWLVDGRGVWQWRQIGYDGDGDADFEKEMLGRLESTKVNP